ncbi:MAG: hypothetical protein KatS3mg076_0213 [Candidatus Binatia bacterium]|nr:MAG: hypothetical protein KatS3mg076_0213 [Candidatus Binatia bacterium]
MNAVWLGLLAASVLWGAFAGNMEAVSRASVESAKDAVTLAIGLVGVMAFWLGMMRVLEEAGALQSLARLLRPVMRRLFPDVPPDHPAMSAMILNFAANMLGLGNAATPFGIKAMAELEKLNPCPGVATNAMALFLALNTSGLALAPLGVIALRASLGSRDPAGIWIPTLVATSFSTTVALVSAKILEKLVPFPGGDPPGRPSVSSETVRKAEESGEPLAGGDPAPFSRAGCVLSALVVSALLAGACLRVVGALGAGETPGAVLREFSSHWLLPSLALLFALYGVSRGVAVYEALVRGAREGFELAVRIIPFLVAILVAAGMARASGLLAGLGLVLGPLLRPLGFPPEALPVALLRPLSGSGAYGVMAEILSTYGPDSSIGYLVSTLQGSTETTFYVLAVYFGAAGVARARHALAAGLLADLGGVVAATCVVRWWVGG